MSDTTKDDRAVELARQAGDAVKSGRLAEAKDLLSQASTLSPEHVAVKAGWQALKGENAGSPLTDACKRWVESRKEEDGEEVLRLAKGSILSREDAEEAFNVLYEWKGEEDLLDEVTGFLLANPNPGGHLALAKAFQECPTQTYYELFERGDQSIDGLLRVMMNRDAWPSPEVFKQAHRDCFMLALAMTMEEALDYPERAMKGVAKLLATHAQDLRGIIDADCLNVILESLDIRNSAELRGSASLATVKLLEHRRDTAAELIKDFVTERVKTSTTHSLIIAFSTAAAIFRMDAPASAALFLSEGFVPTLTNLVRTKESTTLEKTTLELIDAACVDKACREAILRHCSEWLEEQAKSGPRPNLAAAILFKLDLERQHAGAEAGKLPEVLVGSEDKMITRFINNLSTFDPQAKKDSVEGLAFASLRPKVREDLSNNPQFLQALIMYLKSSPGNEVLFGGLNILVNLTEFLPIQDEEAKRMAQLRAYAQAQVNKQKPKEPDPLLSEENVTARCTRVMEAGVTPFLVTAAKQGSPGVITSIVRILSALTHSKANRAKLVQQGAVRLLLQIYADITKYTSDKNPSQPTQQASFPNAPFTLSTAAQALARVLISVNPNLIFPAKNSFEAAIRPLTSSLTAGENPSPAWQLYAFESLLALTNIASMGPEAQETIVKTCFDTVNDDLLLSQNTLVRRAASQLICNLMGSPYGIAKFADPADKRAPARLKILLAMADVDDAETRKAAGGALAMILDLAGDLAVSALLKQDTWAKHILGLSIDDDEDVKHRGMVCLSCILSAEDAALANEAKTTLEKNNAVELLQSALAGCKNQAVLASGMEVLKIMVGKAQAT